MRPTTHALFAVAIAAGALATAVPAQSRDERSAAIGMRARIDQIVLEGSELVAAPSPQGAPIVVRVLQTWPHGTHFRYDLEWSGLEAGKHDVAKYLARKDGSPLGSITIPVTVTGVLNFLRKGNIEPSELAPVAPERLDGYRTQGIVAAVVWGVGLLLVLFVGRRWRRRGAPDAPKATLADRLRPLVEAVAEGRADDATKAELERVLLAFWRSRLDLGSATAAAAMVAIREHPEAGALSRQIEAWLHMPVPDRSIDLKELLAPYRAVSADDLRPIAPKPVTATDGARVR